MWFNKIISTDARKAKDFNGNKPYDIDKKITELLDIKKLITQLEKRKNEIEYSPEYIEGNTQETPSAAWIQVNQERQNILQQLNGSKRKNIEGLNSQLKNAIQNFARHLATHKLNIFYILGSIFEKDQVLADNINSDLTKFKDFYRKSLGEEIRKLFNLPAYLKLYVELKGGGASEGFKVRFNGITVYLKESMSYVSGIVLQHSRINPKELFVYKILEYTHLGPKTKFIVQPYSTGRSGAKLCFICTYDVVHTKTPDQKIKQFVVDNLDLKTETDSEAFQLWQEALKNVPFKIELLSMSMLDDVLLLLDTFDTNSGNYGVVKVTDRVSRECRFKPKMIDHLPYSRVAESNGRKFKYHSLADVVQSFNEKLRMNKTKKESRHSPRVTALGILLSKQNIDFTSVLQQARQRLLGGKIGKDKSGIQDALERAHMDITQLIQQYPNSFVEDSTSIMAAYMSKIQEHLRVLSRLQ